MDKKLFCILSLIILIIIMMYLNLKLNSKESFFQTDPNDLSINAVAIKTQMNEYFKTVSNSKSHSDVKQALDNIIQNSGKYYILILMDKIYKNTNKITTSRQVTKFISKYLNNLKRFYNKYLGYKSNISAKNMPLMNTKIITNTFNKYKHQLPIYNNTPYKLNITLGSNTDKKNDVDFTFYDNIVLSDFEDEIQTGNLNSMVDKRDITFDWINEESSEIIIKSGTTVNFVEDDTHNLMFADMNDKPTVQNEEGITFIQPGIYKYWCDIHPNMSGKIIVLSSKHDEPTTTTLAPTTTTLAPTTTTLAPTTTTIAPTTTTIAPTTTTLAPTTTTVRPTTTTVRPTTTTIRPTTTTIRPTTTTIRPTTTTLAPTTTTIAPTTTTIAPTTTTIAPTTTTLAPTTTNDISITVAPKGNDKVEISMIGPENFLLEGLTLDFNREYTKCSDDNYEDTAINKAIAALIAAGTMPIQRSFGPDDPDHLLSSGMIQPLPNNGGETLLIARLGRKLLVVPTEKTVVLTLDVDGDNNEFDIKSWTVIGCNQTDKVTSNNNEACSVKGKQTLNGP
jgi:plastocyanin